MTAAWRIERKLNETSENERRRKVSAKAKKISGDLANSANESSTAKNLKRPAK